MKKEEEFEHTKISLKYNFEVNPVQFREILIEASRGAGIDKYYDLNNDDILFKKENSSIIFMQDQLVIEGQEKSSAFKGSKLHSIKNWNELVWYFVDSPEQVLDFANSFTSFMKNLRQVLHFRRTPDLESLESKTKAFYNLYSTVKREYPSAQVNFCFLHIYLPELNNMVIEFEAYEEEISDENIVIFEDSLDIRCSYNQLITKSDLILEKLRSTLLQSLFSRDNGVDYQMKKIIPYFLSSDKSDLIIIKMKEHLRSLDLNIERLDSELCIYFQDYMDRLNIYFKFRNVFFFYFPKTDEVYSFRKERDLLDEMKEIISNGTRRYI